MEKPNAAMRTHTTATRLIPLNQWNAFHPWPPIGGLRHLVFHSDKNGFNRVVKRVAGRVLIDESAFFAWASEQGRGR